MFSLFPSTFPIRLDSVFPVLLALLLSCPSQHSMSVRFDYNMLFFFVMLFQFLVCNFNKLSKRV